MLGGWFDYLVLFYRRFGEDLLAGESLRAIHRLYSDIASYDCQPHRHQKEKIRKLLSNLPRGLGEGQIRDLLLVHTETQPWRENLKLGVESIVDRIRKYRKAG
ncbi:MAG: hypothetical protein ABIG28_00285 [archaeon]